MTHLTRQQPTVLYCFANRLERIPVLGPVFSVHAAAELARCGIECRSFITVQSRSSAVPAGFASRLPFVVHHGKANDLFRRPKCAVRGFGAGNYDRR